MADAVKELVAKFTLDTSSWSPVVQKARQTMADAAAEDAARTAAANKATQQAVTLLQKEIALTQQLTGASNAGAAAEKSKTNEITKQQAAQQAAAKAALDAINQQIAAEKLKEASAKAALAEQRRAAAEAISIAKNAMAAQQQIAKDAAASTKAAIAEANKRPTQDFSKIPIVSAVQPTKELPVRDGEKVDQRNRSQQEAQAPTIIPTSQTEAQTATAAAEAEMASVAVSSETEIQAAVNATSASYQKLAAATIELKTAQTNLAETQAAIADGTLADDAAQKRLAIDLQAVAAAQAEVNEAKSVSLTTTADQAAYEVYVENLAKRKAADATYQEEELLSYKAYLAQRALAESESNAQLGHSSGSSNGISNRMAVSGDLRVLSGRGGYRAAETAVAAIPGAAALAQAVFPVAGAAALVTMIGEGITALTNFYMKLKEGPDTIRMAFDSETADIQKSTDESKKAQDEAQNAIDKMEHKPTNNLAISLDDAKIAADALATAADGAYEKVKKLLDENDVGVWASLIAKIGNLFGGDNATDTTTATKSDIMTREREEQRAKYQMQKDTQAAKTPAEAQAAKDKYLSVVRRNAKYYQDQADSKEGYEEEVQDPNAVVDLNTGQLENSTIRRRISPEEGRRRMAAGDQTVHDLGKENQNNLDLYQGMASIKQDTLNEYDQQNATKQTQQTQKQLEEQQRAFRDQLAAAEAHYAALKELAANSLEEQKLDIDKLSEANEQSYKEGTESAADYYAKKKELSAQTLQDTLADIETERQADLAILNEKRKGDPTLQGRNNQKYNDEAAKINSQYDLKSNTAKAANDRSNSADVIAQQEAADQQAIANIQAVTDAKVKAIAQQTEANKQGLQAQTVDAEQYLQTSKDLIQQELDAKVSGLNAQIAIAGEYSTKAIELQKQIVDATAAAVEQQDQLISSAPKTRLDYANSVYQQQQSAFAAQQDTLNSPYSNTTSYDQINLNKQQEASMMSFMNSLISQRGSLGGTNAQTSSNPALYDELTLKIQQTTTAFDQLYNKTQTLINQGAVPSIAGVVGTGVSGLSSIFTSRYAKGVESSLGSAAASSGQQPGYAAAMTQGFGGIGSAFTKGENQNDGSIFSGISAGLQSFTKGLAGAVGAVGSFASAVANAGSASAGGLAGGLAGISSGVSVGASIGGPMGAGVGAGLAALQTGLGALMGQKQEEVQDDINTLNTSFKQTMDDYSSNNSSLAATISSLQSLIAQAEADMANTKKGGSQFKDLIQQYNQEIMQLEDQQEQQLAQLTQSLTTLGEASPYQSMLSSISSILQQYEQFAGAATNATQLAQANQFLTSSLQQLGTTYSQQLLQDETQAVQDALNLNDLYTQRNQLQQQFLQQTESIVGQGTLTRGITQSQSKFSKLYDLDVNNQNQMDSLNAQIATAQYQVQAEQQIFNLATTKQGLETQLVQLQEVGINQDMARIAAMQNLLNVLQQSGYSITNLGSINQSNPNAATSQILSILAGLLNNSSTSATIAGSNGSSLLATILGLAYGGQTGIGYGGFNGNGLI